MSSAVLQPRTPLEVADAVRGHARLLPVGAGTKPALSAPPPDGVALSLRGLAGIVAYEPGEYTFTALAGTPLGEIGAALRSNGQYLPFDPPLAAAGATLGGAIASGLSGAGRYRYGGVRDFILGVQYVSGEGELARAGGKVVKNAAGFDLPKVFVGSLGRLGVVVEATFKVFPRPRAYATLAAGFPDLAAALEAMARLGASPFDIEALELEPPGTLWIRLGGGPETFAERLARLEKFAGGSCRRLEDAAEEAFWRDLGPPRAASPAELVAKVPLTPRAIPAVDRDLEAAGARRRYSGGGSVAWITWTGSCGALDAWLRTRALAGLVISGPGTPLVGVTRGDGFRRRVKAALDPAGRFPNF